MDQGINAVKNDLTQQVIATNSALFVLALIVITVLLAVIVMQTKKIQDLQKPKFGFLGKSLSVLGLFVIMAGGLGLTFIANQDTSVSVSNSLADASLELKIIVTQTKQDEYLLQAVPYINSFAWGNNSQFKFDIYWTITNKNVMTETEFGLTQENAGGILKRFPKGEFIVKASTFFNQNLYSAETILEVL